MSSLLFIAFISMMSGLFITFELSPFDMATDVLKKSAKKEQALNEKIKALTGKKKKKGLKKLIDETKHVLKMTNKENLFMLIVMLSLA
ncbi:MAG: hypothetical protein PWP16_1782 [Eubacteriaceae bacterium]|nr:hypothetical protein [Eubacteriaceae bacterium]